MATVLRRRPAPRNSGNKIVVQTVTSQPAVEAHLKAGAVKGIDQSSNSGSSSSRQDSSHEASINSSSVSCVYEQKMCATCACPTSCCLCSTAFSTFKGVQWTGKMNALPGCKGDGSSSTGSGSESNIKPSGWGHNEPLFLATAAALTALQALILALQRVNGRSWAEKALEAQANACMFWVQAAAHAVGQDDDFKPRFASGSSAFHDAEMLLALPDCEQGQEKRRKRSAPSSKQQGWQPSLSFSPALSSSPSGSSGFSFVQGDDLDEPSTLEPSVLESLVQTLIGTTPGTGTEQAPPSPLDKLADTVGKSETSPPEKEKPPSPSQASSTSSTSKTEQVKEVVKTDSVKVGAVNPALLPPVSKKLSETMTRKQKRNLKKKNKSSVPSSVTVTPRDRPASAK